MQSTEQAQPHSVESGLMVLSFIEPMVPTLSAEPPEGEGWIHEIKYDGYRTQIVIDAGGVRAFTRNGYDWSDRYPAALAAAGGLKVQSAILDGEMIVQDEQGRSDFFAFQRAITEKPEQLVFMAFDLLHLEGADLASLPLLGRRERLREIIGANKPGCCIQFSDHMEGNGADFFEAVDAIGLEGIVSKKANSRYRSGRTRQWLKIKCFAEAEFVVVGVQREPGCSPAALLARETEAGLSYAGSAFVTLTYADREIFWRIVEALEVPAPAVPILAKKAQWTTPELRVRAQYLKGSDKLRHATLKTLLI